MNQHPPMQSRHWCQFNFFDALLAFLAFFRNEVSAPPLSDLSRTANLKSEFHKSPLVVVKASIRLEGRWLRSTCSGSLVSLWQGFKTLGLFNNSCKTCRSGNPARPDGTVGSLIPSVMTSDSSFNDFNTFKVSSASPLGSSTHSDSIKSSSDGWSNRSANTPRRQSSTYLFSRAASSTPPHLATSMSALLNALWQHDWNLDCSASWEK